MDRKFEQLYHILERIAALHATLLETLRAENAAMIAVDVKSLAEITQTKEALLSEIWHCEQSRIVHVQEIAGDAVSLVELAKIAPNPWSQKFLVAHTALNLCIEQCREVNRENLEFAQGSLERIEAMKKNILGLNNNNAENYNAQGNRNPVPGQGGRLVSQRA